MQATTTRRVKTRLADDEGFPSIALSYVGGAMQGYRRIVRVAQRVNSTAHLGETVRLADSSPNSASTSRIKL